MYFELDVRPSVTGRDADTLSVTHREPGDLKNEIRSALDAFVKSGGDSANISTIAITASADMTIHEDWGDDWYCLNKIKTDEFFPELTGARKLAILGEGVTNIPAEAMSYSYSWDRENSYYQYGPSGAGWLESFEAPSAKTVGDHAFSDCVNLFKIDLPSVVSVGEGVFSGCGALVGANLPSVTAIGNRAFENCVSLEDINFPSARVVGENAFSSSGVKRVNMPAAVTIGPRAFYGRALTEAVFPSAIDIGPEAFYGAVLLEKADMPNARNIGNKAFAGCGSLQRVNLSSAVDIGDAAFSECAFSSLDLPSARTIGGHSFSGCSRLVKIDIPSAVTVGDYAFTNANLERVNFPAVESIGTRAFINNNNIKQVNLPSLKTVGGYLFYGGYFIESVNLASAVSIGNNAFDGCRNLRRIMAPSAVSIGSYAFRECSGLVDITLPSAANIGASAFETCTGLETVVLPSVEIINDSAFLNTGYFPVVEPDYPGSIARIYLGNADPVIGRYAFRDMISGDLSVYASHGNRLSRGPYPDEFVRYDAAAPAIYPGVTSVTVAVGGRARLSPKVLTGPDGVSLAGQPDYSWANVTPGVVSLDEDGTLKGVSEGTGRIIYSARIPIRIPIASSGKLSDAEFLWVVSGDVRVNVKAR
jgi:hypothetical protein